MDNNGDNKQLLSMVGDYGIGMLTLQVDGLRSRPVLPVIDRSSSEIICIFDRHWLGDSAFGEPTCVLNFLNDYTYRSLSIRGVCRCSSQKHDIAMAWNGLCDRMYPDGRETPGVLAMRIAPRHAQLWRLGHAEPEFHWAFETGSVWSHPKAR